MNKFEAAINARIEAERAKATMNANNIKRFERARDYVAQKAVADFLTKAEYDANTVNRTVVANEKFDVYAFEVMTSILQFATKSLSADKMIKNANEITRTIINLSNAKLDATREDFLVALDKGAQHSDKTRAKHIVKRATQFDTGPRYVSANIAALCALNVLTAKARDVYAINAKGEAFKAIKARFAEIA